MTVAYRGGAMSRPGTAMVGVSLQSTYLAANTSTGPPRLIPFQFSITQGYILEFGDQYIRFIYDGGYVLENSVAITGTISTSPAGIMVSGSPFNDGDWVYITGVEGPTQLNDQVYIVTGALPGIFYLNTPNGQPFNAIGFPGYISGGTVARLYTISSPYAASDLPYLKFAQSADVMSLTLSNPAANTEYTQYDLVNASHRESFVGSE